MRAIGICWYEEADYERLKAIFVDGAQLPRTFQEWQQKAEQLRQSRIAQGEVVVKAYIDPDSFPSWCAARGLDVNASSRMHYANTVAHEHALKIQANGGA
jgi:hypothetical protein